MSQFSAEIRRSHEWWVQYTEKEARKEWATSALERTWIVQTPSQQSSVKLSQRQVDYVLDELEGYAALRDEHARCQVSCFERIWESDNLLDLSETAELVKALELLKSEVSLCDDGITRYFVDHRLYPLIYNKTLVSQLNGRFLRPVSPPPSTDVYTVSPNFTFLPSDVFVSSDASSVKFISYINNLHPQTHRNTYRLLENLLARFIPLFEHSLTDLHRNNHLVQRIAGHCRYTIWDEPEPPEHSDDEDGWTNYERALREWTMNRPINLPDVPHTGYPGGLEKRRFNVKLRNRTLQIIVSALEIELSPQRSTFSGSVWHVEGMRSERIVACGFHCLSIDNITETLLKFRMAVTYPRGFSAGDTGATLRTWGIRDGDSCHQPIVSTANVAPQQKSWMHKALDDNLDTRLPHEVIEKILENVEGVMTSQEAEEYRKKLVEANEQFTLANNSYHFCIPFDIWNGPEMWSLRKGKV
ncbi:hypothetical protein JR316_0000466 [Psilocybe cubensis]|uniref:DUF4246 domain-containing protein n=2 Tax=Psilocybe cubensis TaxID=181762 RepID=A0A8H7Y9J3_PSICU|nr:hypothetical protein JR316_0000466 [Psilocybe cubensis]KAH9486402.1 hypothetical protein JR316_0000466 [Psilocybe cubensis]